MASQKSLSWSEYNSNRPFSSIVIILKKTNSWGKKDSVWTRRENSIIFIGYD